MQFKMRYIGDMEYENKPDLLRKLILVLNMDKYPNLKVIAAEAEIPYTALRNFHSPKKRSIGQDYGDSLNRWFAKIGIRDDTPDNFIQEQNARINKVRRELVLLVATIDDPHLSYAEKMNDLARFARGIVESLKELKVVSN